MLTERKRVHFTVTGLAATQGSKTAYRNQYTGKMNVVEGATKAARIRFGTWRQAVIDEARRQAEEVGTLDGELHVSMTFYLPKPKSAPLYKEWVAVAPDFDKLARAVADGLKLSTLIADDSRIVECWIGKRYAIDHQPGVDITIIVGTPAEPEALQMFGGSTS